MVEHAVVIMDVERGQHRIDFTHPDKAVLIRRDAYRFR
jgi:hypothetical protein